MSEQPDLQHRLQTPVMVHVYGRCLRHLDLLKVYCSLLLGLGCS